jgi:hypothetical protein|tara:strand:+ start:18477 stop:18653 length:177 start_codon:yes stop_codon:yes gene_type:complete
MKDANYNFTDWRQLEYMERAMHVAHYRFTKLVDLHKNDAVTDRVERDQKRIAAKGKRK